jgi:prepilin-type N-terminal cleavage/methylation domain-containing protein
MCIRRFRKSCRGWTLVEMMVAVGLFSIAGAALMTLYVYSIKSFASLANYALLDMQNRQAMDLLTKELRQARYIKSYSSNSVGNSLTFRNGDGYDVSYNFNEAKKVMIRQVNGSTTMILTNCDLLSFSLFQRNPMENSYGLFPVASGNWTQTVKVVQLTWKTKRHVPAGPINSENVQTARVVIRKQQDK